MRFSLACACIVALQLVSAAPATAQGAARPPAGAAALIEIEAIKTLKARYYRLMDTKQWAEWRQVFADDLVAETDVAPTTFGGDPGTITTKGGDEFVKMVSTYLARCTSVHHGHMPEIALTSPTTATGIWSLEDIVECPGSSTVHGYGHYRETYRKDARGRWQIATLRLTRLKVESIPAAK